MAKIGKIEVDLEVEVAISVKSKTNEIEWYSERVDEEDGSTHYEAHRNDESKNDYIRFEGVNAQKYCGIFMEAIKNQKG